jgi:hypothetical protein
MGSSPFRSPRWLSEYNRHVIDLECQLKRKLTLDEGLALRHLIEEGLRRKAELFIDQLITEGMKG